MKHLTAAAVSITAFSFLGLLALPMNADAGRFRGGNMVQSNVATQTRTAAQYQNRGQQGPGTNFVDADGDGICDNTGLPVGVRPGTGMGTAQGVGFVDADGDGVNDNFVDLNNDGICDLRQ